MVKHTVAPGEGLSSIAERYGLLPKTIWEDPANEKLRSEREDPNILAPGDVLSIPDKRLSAVEVSTGRTHRFRKRNVPAMLRLQIFDDADQPRANQAYVLTIDGVERRGETDGNGVLREPVPPSAKHAVLEIGPDRSRIEIQIGYVDPLKTVRGIKSRLRNLGFECADGDEPDEALRAVVSAFQRRFALTVNGDWQDPDLASTLAKLHDRPELLPPAPEPGPALSDEPA